MVTYYRDFCGATASIKDNKDGTATLTMMCCGKRTRKVYKNRKSAYAAWYRYCN